MHNAPAVTYPVGRARQVGAMVATVWLLALAVIVAAAPLTNSSLIKTSAAVAVWLVCGSAAWRWWQSTVHGRLSWNGAEWLWTPKGLARPELGHPEVIWDMQRVLLVLWHGQTQRQWLWLVQSAQAAHWLDLRRAVYSRPRIDASDADSPTISP